MVLDFNSFAICIEEWSQFRQDFYKNLFPLIGGWNAWAQADLAAFLLQQNSTYDILREASVFTNPSQKVDLLFNNNAATSLKISIELRCQAFDNISTFITGLQGDISKLQQGNLQPAYMGMQTGTMAMYFEANARNWVVANGYTEVFNNGDIGTAIKRLA